MTNENTARDLGRMEGKLDLLLQMHQREIDTANLWRTAMETRVTSLETWKTKANTLYAGGLTLLGAIWGAVQFFFK